MCGIFGYIGKKEISNLLIEGLKKLEYRGYDSWGIALKQDDSIFIEKHIGKISDTNISKSKTSLLAKSKKIISNISDSNSNKTNLGIAHTRWATHGSVTQDNAHPHISCNGKIAVVHNGIIENYEFLKKMLQSEGHIFKSETDTEVIVHLIEKFYEDNLEKAIFKTLPHLIGTYGIIAMHANETKLVCARNGSPLVLGIGKNEYFIASDVSPLMEYTQKVIYLDDGDVLTINENNYQITDILDVKQKKTIDKITWSTGKIDKNGYAHFMLKEIYEQPETIINTLRGRLINGQVKLGGITLSSNEANSIKRIIIVACGTSWHAGLVGEYLFEEYLNIPVEVEYASEFRYRNPPIDNSDLVIAISQSGETADTLAALKLAKEKGALTIGIVNVVGSTIARVAGLGIYLHAGLEIGVASTKAFTSQIVALCLLNLYLGNLRLNSTQNKTNDNDKNKELEVALKKLSFELSNLPNILKEVLIEVDLPVKKIADKYYKSNNFLYLGRGFEFPVALEGALKLKEISYIHAEGYPAAEMKHGPIALIDEKMPVVFLASKNAAYDKILSNIMEVKARGGKIIVITTKGNTELEKISDDIIYTPLAFGPIVSIINIIPLQLLAYYIADLRGCDIDKPRNLAKSVTVE